jgi:phosphoribosylamine--glycine ligase
MKVLLVGGGGREHALAWRLSQSEHCDALYCAPGNPGIADVAECVSIAADDVDALTSFAVEKNIDLVVAGPEAPLVAGLADRLNEKNIRIFGATQLAARLEGSKGFTKDLCRKYDIPTAAYERFTDAEPAKAFIEKTGYPIVIKADGLAAGKGVIIAQNKAEAFDAVDDMLSGNLFGASGSSIVVEEFLDGEELSFFALTDGKTILPFASAQDHKRVGDGDVGPNTGGMGAYSPAHLLTPALQEKIMNRIIKPTVAGMEQEGCPFSGILFAGIMVVKDEPYLIEYNVRFGDPECQPLMMRLQTDLLQILDACARGELSSFENKVSWSEDIALAVVMAAKGYPAAYAKGGVISGIEKADAIDGVKVFHAGTSTNESGQIISTGGRVLGVTAMGVSVKEAQAKAYMAVDQIDWADGFCRRDIGWRAVNAA